MNAKKNAVMKSHHSIVLISSATRIRTWKMLESESSALPFGDSALSNMFMIIQDCPNVKHFFEKYIKLFVIANADRYNYITEEAIRFVQQYRDKYEIEDMMLSFSGGKDSTVTSHIVNRALGTNRVLHIFGDTTLEFPFTYEYAT